MASKAEIESALNSKMESLPKDVQKKIKKAVKEMKDRDPSFEFTTYQSMVESEFKKINGETPSNSSTSVGGNSWGSTGSFSAGWGAANPQNLAKSSPKNGPSNDILGNGSNTNPGANSIQEQMRRMQGMAKAGGNPMSMSMPWNSGGQNTGLSGFQKAASSDPSAGSFSSGGNNEPGFQAYKERVVSAFQDRSDEVPFSNLEAFLKFAETKWMRFADSVDFSKVSLPTADQINKGDLPQLPGDQGGMNGMSGMMGQNMNPMMGANMLGYGQPKFPMPHMPNANGKGMGKGMNNMWGGMGGGINPMMQMNPMMMQQMMYQNMMNANQPSNPNSSSLINSSAAKWAQLSQAKKGGYSTGGYEKGGQNSTFPGSTGNTIKSTLDLGGGGFSTGITSSVVGHNSLMPTGKMGSAGKGGKFGLNKGFGNNAGKGGSMNPNDIQVGNIPGFTKSKQEEQNTSSRARDSRRRNSRDSRSRSRSRRGRRSKDSRRRGRRGRDSRGRRKRNRSDSDGDRDGKRMKTNNSLGGLQPLPGQFGNSGGNNLLGLTKLSSFGNFSMKSPGSDSEADGYRHPLSKASGSFDLGGAKGKGKKGNKGWSIEPNFRKLDKAIEDAGGLSGTTAPEVLEVLRESLKWNNKTVEQITGLKMGQYLAAKRNGTYTRPEPGTTAGPSNASKNHWFEDEDEADKINARAQRFNKSLKTPAKSNMYSYGDDDDEEKEHMSAEAIVGELNVMCSKSEITDRQSTRQLDRFELAANSNPDNPTCNPALMVKKYQRSSADKKYRAEDIRTLSACWKSVEYLFTNIMYLDLKPMPKTYYFKEKVPYIQIYSYIRDRIRAVRVDLHVQQPKSTTTMEYIRTHENAFRFELLSNFICKAETDVGPRPKTQANVTEKYDEKMAMKAISQTIEPLLSAYKIAREASKAKTGAGKGANGSRGSKFPASPAPSDSEDASIYLSPAEPAIRRLTILLQIHQEVDLLSQLGRLDEDMLSHPLVSDALDLFTAFSSGDHAAFLRFYRECDFFSACAIGNKVDIVRYKVLCDYARAAHGSLGNTYKLSVIQKLLCLDADKTFAVEFLQYCGLEVNLVAHQKKSLAKDKPVKALEYDTVVIPKKEMLQRHGILLDAYGRPAHKDGPSILGAFDNFYKISGNRDPILVAKYNKGNLERKDWIFGLGDAKFVEKPKPNTRPRVELKSKVELKTADEVADTKKDARKKVVLEANKSTVESPKNDKSTSSTSTKEDESKEEKKTVQSDPAKPLTKKERIIEAVKNLYKGQLDDKKISETLLKYKDKEEQLYRTLCEKYSRVPELDCLSDEMLEMLFKKQPALKDEYQKKVSSSPKKDEKADDPNSKSPKKESSSSPRKPSPKKK